MNIISSSLPGHYLESKKLFQILMNQETYHYRTVENLLDLVQTPQWWVEDAEFNPRDSGTY